MKNNNFDSYRKLKRDIAIQKSYGKWMIGRKRESSNNWKGGKYLGEYIRIINDEDKVVQEHRNIVEKNIGRKLKQCEIIHHIDENKKNNNIYNLIILDRKEHFYKHKHFIIKRQLEERMKNPNKFIGNLGNHKIPKKQWDYIRFLKNSGETIVSIAKKYNTTRNTIYKILGDKYVNGI